jgi:integrase
VLGRVVASGKAAWGSIRKLPSGRWQARYRVEGRLISADVTFRTKRDAEVYLSTVRADIERGIWINPAAGRITLREYATAWLEQRPNIRPRTRESYESQLRLHILPVLGNTELAKITTRQVRSWNAAMLNAGRPGAITAAKCYRLLRTILGTAVADELLFKNPCVIKGAGVEKTPERPVATIDQIYEIADAIEPRLRAIVLTAAFTGLRLGELRALTRERVDLLHSRLKVVEQYQDLADGTLLLCPPKSEAGRRTIAIPAILKPELEAHLATFAAPGKKGLVFCGTLDQPFRIATLHAAWKRATAAVGIEGFKFHDLRHTGNTLAASTGASTKELMARMGHASPRAALIYQHATEDRDQEIAEALSVLVGAKRTNQARGMTGPTSIGQDKS